MDFETANEKIKEKKSLMKREVKMITVEEATAQLHEKLNLTGILKQAEGYQITDESTAQQALSMSLQARKLRKALDESRKQIVKPHVDFQRAVNKIVKDFDAKLSDIEMGLSAKLNNWVLLKREMADDLSPNEHDKITVEDGKMVMKKYWDFCVDDFDQIPHSYLMIEEAKIKEAIKAGIRNIPGIRVFENEKLALRTQ